MAFFASYNFFHYLSNAVAERARDPFISIRDIFNLNNSPATAGRPNFHSPWMVDAAAFPLRHSGCA